MSHISRRIKLVENLNGHRIGEVEENLVGNYDGDLLRRSNGGLVGRLAKDFHSDHQTARGSGVV